MIEDTIVEALAAACSLTLGVDIWGCAMPDTQETGVCVTVLQDVDTRLNVLGSARLAIYIVKTNYYDCRALAASIAAALNAQYGLSVWAAESVSSSYKGVDESKHHLFVVYVSIRKE